MRGNAMPPERLLLDEGYIQVTSKRLKIGTTVFQLSNISSYDVTAIDRNNLTALLVCWGIGAIAASIGFNSENPLLVRFGGFCVMILFFLLGSWLGFMRKPMYVLRLQTNSGSIDSMHHVDPNKIGLVASALGKAMGEKD